MSATQEAKNKAVEARTAKVQDLANTSKAHFDDVQKVIKWTEFPENPDMNDVATLFSFIQTNPNAGQFVSPDVYKGLQDYLTKLQNDDFAKLHTIAGLAEQKGQAPKLGPGALLFEMTYVEPEEGSTEWTFLAFPLVIGEDFKVSIPEKLDGTDIYLTMYPAPRGNTLKEKFNVDMVNIPSGQAIEPVEITVDAKDANFLSLHLTGHLTQNGQAQALNIMRELPARAQQPETTPDADDTIEGPDGQPMRKPGGGAAPPELRPDAK